jgi:hypothetical protein
MTDPEKEFGKQQGLNKEAWTAISAVAVAIIGGTVTVATTLLNKQPSPGSATTDSPTQPKMANIPLGKWSGMAKDPSGMWLYQCP